VKELEVQRLLGTALLATKGYAAPETGRTYTRAHELCRIVGVSADISPVLTGVYLFEFTRANHAVGKRTVNGRRPTSCFSPFTTGSPRALTGLTWSSPEPFLKRSADSRPSGPAVLVGGGSKPVDRL
jgi:hypothetical protein